MSLRLGMPTLLERPALLDCAALCARLGLSFVELSMNLPMYQHPVMDEKAIRTARKVYGVGCTLHLDESLNPFDFNPLVREAYVRTTLDAIGMARRQSLPLLNMHLHPGVYFTLPHSRAYLFDTYRDHYLRCVEDFRARCEAAIDGDDVLICVENMDGFAPFAREGIELLLESDAFGLTLDIGHAHRAGHADDALYARHRGRLAHMHIHDADADCHLPLGEGVLDIRAALVLAASRGCRAVLEVKTIRGLTRSVEWLRAERII